jgi:hypothetical protein
MRYHVIEAEVPCPHCGRGNVLSYESTGVRGDLYRCSACLGRAVHRRQNCGRGCGLTPLREFGKFGGWQACRWSSGPSLRN